jgi:hypothetical protein
MNYLRRSYSENTRISGAILERASLEQKAFHRLIALERRRAERSRKSFLLMLVDASQRPFDMSRAILESLMPMTRETDIVGWYKEGIVAGVLFTEIVEEDIAGTTTAIMNRVSKTLKNHLTALQFNKVSLSFHLLPEEHDRKTSSHHAAAAVAHSSVATPSLAAELR